MPYNLIIDNPYVIENEDFCIYSNQSLKKLSDKSLEELKLSKKRILDFFKIDKFRKVIMINFDDIDEFRKYVLSLREPGAHLPKYATGVFDKGMIISYIDSNIIKDKYHLNQKIKNGVHEFVHIINREKIYQERVIWLDEGLATNLETRKDNFENDNKFIEYLKEKILGIEDLPIMNDLTPQGTGFKQENYDGYDLVYVCVRYLLETTEKNRLLEILKDYNLSIEVGKTVLQDAINYYKNKSYPT